MRSWDSAIIIKNDPFRKQAINQNHRQSAKAQSETVLTLGAAQDEMNPVNDASKRN